ncbi:uncharacterized protein BYT42DRAFT_498190 [Radiomyces spectabilis]|uniref:uncharacterized protein n=1 Tax=Radiomyces spectabilis TaxID=64574 RepID=UPI00221ED6CA|nr:uncharacterized protein BYT42DRAFT_498190 [Radiomyces spectabilis]KAI8376359.1 hypothetical protein BYT42DRAFT_498190 [Radiomyces spectabilis]
MEGATAARTHVLSLYRNFLRYGNKFASYNFRDYAIRRSRDAFRAHQNETNPDKINQLIQKAETELQVVKRQATISQLYTRGDRLVVEKP